MTYIMKLFLTVIIKNYYSESIVCYNNKQQVITYQLSKYMNSIYLLLTLGHHIILYSHRYVVIDDFDFSFSHAG